MAVWIIEPHDPLIVRDGKPFFASAGARSTSLPFPFPSTTTGGVRTRAGLNDKGVFSLYKKEDITELKKLAVRGPLLVQLDDNDAGELLVTAPLDALLFELEEGKERSGQVMLERLVPLVIREGIAYSEFSHYQGEQLHVVGLVHPDASKPAKNVPSYWHWKKFEQWLIDPNNECGIVTLNELGHSGPGREQRTHVSIDADRASADEGMLFVTSGLEFTHVEKSAPLNDKDQASQESNTSTLSNAKRLALAVIVDENTRFANKVHNGLTGFGGERRVVSWRKSSITMPSCSEQIVQEIVKRKACRVILLTPAYFAKGYHPTWLTQERYGVKPELKAVAVQRPLVISGWDLDIKAPKPTRRLAPAGTVLFLSLQSNSEKDIRAWIDKMWMQCISDDPEENRIDGFGVAVVGTWSGKPEEIDWSEDK